MVEAEGSIVSPGFPGEIPCPACGAENPPGNRFCGSCGSSLELTCPSCGAANPPGNRFCGTCGTALTPDVPAATAGPQEIEERKLVTVLFADLTGSTELATSMDAEDLRGVLTTFFRAMVEEIERHGGTVEKFIGDAVVAVFGVPAAHEDDPERAVRAAIAMHRRLPGLNADLRHTSGVELEMRIGVNTGEVVTATGVDRENLVTGEPVNLAARLEALARPGGIVVGERTWRDTRHSIGYRPLGEVTVKGFDRPVTAYEVEGDLAHSRPATAAAPAVAPMVGRDGELDLLRLVLDRTEREGRASLATVVGPAGIGKSRLSHEFQLAARDRDAPAQVVRGRCLPYGDGLTYWPLAEILKSDAGIMDSDRPDAIRDKAVARLQGRLRSDDPVATVLVLLSSIGVPVEPDPIAGAAPEVARELIARCWRVYFESVAAEGPVVAMIEDLHWADPSLLDVVEGLASRTPAPVMFLAMARPDLWERRPGWGGAVGSGVRIELSPLRQEESEELLRHLLGDRSAPPEALRPVLERSEGNPFFAQELLRMLIEDGYLVRNEFDWRLDRALPDRLPDTVQGVIASRIDLLPPAQKRAIQDASVVGRIFWEGALVALGSSEAPAAVGALVEKGLAWEREESRIEGERELIFNHVLTRDVAYQSIPRSRRAVAHAEALGWIERVTAGREDEFAEILAHHAEAAGDPAKTARYAMLAGHRSGRVFAAEEAIRWYGRALEAAAGMADDARPALEAEVHLRRGEAFEQLGSFPEAEPDYRAAAEAAGRAGDRRLTARALAALAHLHWLQDRYEDGQRVLEQALEAAREVGAANLIAKLLYTAGTIRFGRGEHGEALPLHEEALRVAREAGDLEGEAWARHGLCETIYFLGPLSRALDEGLRSDELLRRIGQLPMVHHNLYMVAYANLFLGRLDDAGRTARESVMGNLELGNRRDEAFALGAMGQVQWQVGRLGEAVELLDGAVDLARSLQSPRLLLGSLVFRALCLAEAGAYEAMGADVREALELSDGLGGSFFRSLVFSMLGVRALARGEIEEGRRRFEESRRLAVGIFTHQAQGGFLEILGWEAARDPDGMAGVASYVNGLPHEEGSLIQAWGWYAESVAAAWGERWDEALDAARRTVQATRRFGAGSLEWRALATAASALAALGRHEEAEPEARAAADAARPVAESLPAGPLREGFEARWDVARALGRERGA